MPELSPVGPATTLPQAEQAGVVSLIMEDALTRPPG